MYSPLLHLCPLHQASDRMQFLFLPSFCDLAIGTSAIHDSFGSIEPTLAEFCSFSAGKTRKSTS